MQPLGALRCRILACIGAENPKLATFFDPPSDRTLDESLRQHLLKLHKMFADDPLSRIFVAAGLLSFGDLACADEILECLPRAPIVTDHGAGWCPLVPYQTLAALLPIPEQHRNVRLWVEGSADAAAVAQWLIENRDQLHWDATIERFTLK